MKWLKDNNWQSQLIICRGSRRRMVDRFIAPKKYIDDNKKRLLFDNEFIDSFFQKLLTRSKRVSNLNKKINPTQQYDIRLEYTEYRDKIGKLKFNYIRGGGSEGVRKAVADYGAAFKVYGVVSSCNVAVIYLQHCGIPNYLVTLVAYRVNQKFRTARFSV